MCFGCADDETWEGDGVRTAALPMACAVEKEIITGLMVCLMTECDDGEYNGIPTIVS